MSGTSMDGVDAVLADMGPTPPRLLAALSHPLPAALAADLRRLAAGGDVDLLGRLDVEVGRLFAGAARAVLARSGRRPEEVLVIGSHGQTVRHRPRDPVAPFTLQIGDPNTIATRTGITTVADFRRRDLALGGEGAPLVPPFHAAVFSAAEARAVLNLGGIANLTLLPARGDPRPVRGFDAGPANTLLDAWYRAHHPGTFDPGGAWAAGGEVIPELLDELLQAPFLRRPPPKSTGPEEFNLDWLREHRGVREARPGDVQRTLVEFTAVSVARALETWAPETRRVLVCGGGVHNRLLMTRIAEAVAPRPTESTAAHGVDPDWVEALAFAWLALRRLEGLPGNLPEVTGASRPACLGGIWPGDGQPPAGG